MIGMLKGEDYTHIMNLLYSRGENGGFLYNKYESYDKFRKARRPELYDIMTLNGKT